MSWLFLDTSALLKLYVDEDGSESVHLVAEAAETLAVCRIAWAEAVSALARRGREVSGDLAALDLAKQALRNDWPHFLITEVTQELVEQAGDFADTFALRAYDGVQLAAGYRVRQSAENELVFACFDKRLAKAANVLGMPGLADFNPAVTP